MSKYNIDEELMKAFEDASLEDINKIMEDVDPSEFEISNTLAKRRIQKNVMTRLKSKTRKTHFKGLGYVAAAVIVVLSGIVFSRTEVAATMFDNIFSFVPGKGIVETEEEEGSDVSVPTTIYELVERGKRDSNDFCSVTYNYGTASGDTLELSYNFRILNFDLDAYSSIYMNANDTNEDPTITLQKFVDFYNGLGYEDYVTYTDNLKMNYWESINGVQSSLYSGDTICPRLSSSLSFGEVGGGIEGVVIETYDISGAPASEGSAYTLKINDFESTFTVSSVSKYASEDDLLSENNAVTCDNIQMICDTHWEDEWLIADFYITDMGDYASVNSLWPWDTDGTYPYAEIGGKEYDAYNTDIYTYDGKDGRPFQFAFEIPENERSGDITIHIDALEVAATIDPIQIDFSGKGDGEFDINNTIATPYGDIILTKGFKYSYDTMPYYIRDFCFETDIIGAFYELISASSDPSLVSIDKCTYNDENIDEHFAICADMYKDFVALETSNLPNDGVLAITNVTLIKKVSYEFTVTAD